MQERIAVVAAACEFAHARTPQQLWRLALHGRQGFRRLPPQRLALGAYLRGDDDADGLYPIEAGLLEGYKFDRARFLVPLQTFAGADMAHWLALDLADRAIGALPGGALADASLKDRTAVVVANTLTGEFSRANSLRYRWPYVEARWREAAAGRLAGADTEALLADFERRFKQAFPPPDADSLAGGLSNTIAGRIANHFGLRGGAHAVDGACASSLVGVVAACDRLRGGDVDLAVVAAVDLSLDPFELVGFARNSALARGEMRVFDADATGFWPGEGGACVILATAALAHQRGWPVLGWVLGTGMSTDGQGGLTRPTAAGQLLALRRAWSAAGLDAAMADYFEAHGTGTPTGDPVELDALAQAIAESGGAPQPIPVGSIKANIGHTKAAAGMAGLLQALAVATERLVPPLAGGHEPHPLLAHTEIQRALRLPRAAASIDHRRPIRVGVNSFGFGGVNCHVVVQGPALVGKPVRRTPVPPFAEGRLPGELVTLSAGSRGELVAALRVVQGRSLTLSRSELIDLAAACRPRAAAASDWRASIVAATPQALQAGCDALLGSLGGAGVRGAGPRWAWSSPRTAAVGLCFVLPGQGLQPEGLAEGWAARLPRLAEPIRCLREAVDASDGGPDTALWQPALAEVAIAALELLRCAGLKPDRVLGHSFGELTAWHAAGIIDAAALRRLAERRGCVMRDFVPPSAMLAIEADAGQASALAASHGVDLACYNSARRHVMAGSTAAIDQLAGACARSGVRAARLPATRAFHSRLMAAAAARLAGELNAFTFGRPRLTVLSTITGGVLADESLPDLLVQQFVAPVRFVQALACLPADDLVIEVGTASALGGLVAEDGGPAALPMALFSASLEPLLHALGAAWVGGHAVDVDWLYADRMVEPYRLDVEPQFLSSPCGEATNPGVVAVPLPAAPPQPIGADDGRPALALLQSIISQLAGLPRESVRPEARLLADLHLNSIRARHALAQAARQLGIDRLPFHASDIASATVAEMAAQLDVLRKSPAGTADAPTPAPAGVAPWVRLFSHRWLAADPGLPDAGAAGWPCQFRLDDRLAPLPDASRSAATGLFTDDPGAPTLLVLPGAGTADVGSALLDAVQAIARDGRTTSLLVLQSAPLANAFLRSVAAERPDWRLCAVQHDGIDVDTLRRTVHAHGALSRGYSEWQWLAGQARQRRLQLHVLDPALAPWLPGPQDLVVISGGAKGIGAAAALRLQQAYRCPLGLLGRSPADDADVQATLLALNAGGSMARYVQVDLCDAVATRAAVRALESELGAVQALVHAAGINRPAALAALDAAELAATVAAKVGALDHLLQALRPGQLRLLVGFASIIGELGLVGEAHYALANEWLVERMHRLAAQTPGTRCLPICWAAWRETGMAARLDGVLDALAVQDTRALDTIEACDQLIAILQSAHQGEALIVSGRHGRPIDPRRELPALHRHRFLAQPRVFYPGVELVADAVVSTESDPYLLEHAPYGLPVLPLVAALEAMLSAAQALRGDASLVAIDALRIGAAIACPAGQSIVLRTVALVQGDGGVDVCIRCSSTDFSMDHFSARVRRRIDALARSGGALAVAAEPLPAARLLYQGLAFHGPSFQRLRDYSRIDARGCQAQLGAGAAGRWYGALQPGALAAGHPAQRDAVLHALQVCIPQHPVLPVAADRIEIGALRSDVEYVVTARQTASDGREFRFDVDVVDPSGGVVERWSGLRLARIPADRGNLALRRSLDPALLPAFVGRLLGDALGEPQAEVGLSLHSERSAASAAAVRHALGPGAALHHHANGAPGVRGARVSVSHGAGLTLAVAHRQRLIGCDVQGLDGVDAKAWPVLLGEQRWAFARDLAAAAGWSTVVACVMVWTAAECLYKIGCRAWPFALHQVDIGDTPHCGPQLVLKGEALAVAVGLLRVAGQPADVAVGVALGAASIDLDEQRQDAPGEPVPADVVSG